MRFCAATFLCILFIASTAFSQQPETVPQQPPFGERVEVDAVLIDAVVTDSRGNQILGLTKDDFVVTEDGVRQTIDSVDYLTTRRLLTSSEESAPFKVERVQESRYFIFFFDKPMGGGFFSEMARAREAINGFIDRDMGSEDLVAIAGHDVRLKIYSDFTSNKQQLKRAVSEVSRFGPGLTRPQGSTDRPSILREIGGKELMNKTGTVYEGIEKLADAVRPIRGRKNLIVFSPGIREPGEQVRDGVLLGTSRYYEPMIQALNDANVTVYAKNLFDSPPPEPVFHQTLQRIADETNGEYYRLAISYEPVLSAVEKASGGYYLITYRSPKKQGQRGFQKVNVSVKTPEFRVKARAGYSYGD